MYDTYLLTFTYLLIWDCRNSALDDGSAEDQRKRRRLKFLQRHSASLRDVLMLILWN